MISYEKLWVTMKKKGISQYKLMKYYGVSAGQLERMKKNMHVSTHTIEKFCEILDCNLEDIMEFKEQDERRREEKD